MGEPGEHQPAGATQLGRVDDRGHVGGAVVPGVRRAADAQARAGRPGRTTSGRWSAGRSPAVAGTTARSAARTSARSASPSAAPTGTTEPTPTRSSESMPRTARRSAGAQGRDVRARAVVVVGVGRAARLLGPERDEHAPATGPDGPRAPPRPRAAVPTPDALSSAPGACGTVSRWAPTTRCGFAGVEARRRGDHVDGPAGSDRDAPRVAAGDGEPLAAYVVAVATGARRCTQAAARRNSGLVACRGPMVPARWRTASRADRKAEVVGRHRTAGRAGVEAVGDVGGRD